MDTQTPKITIALDQKHHATLDPETQRWKIYDQNTKHTTRTTRTTHAQPIETWIGDRRSLLRKTRELNINLTEEAEKQISKLPERRGFIPDRE